MKYNPPATLIGSAERLCLAHRYLYYVLSKSILSDVEYDLLEKRCLAHPDLATDSPLREPGSDLASTYSADIKEHAKRLLRWHKANSQRCTCYKSGCESHQCPIHSR